MEVYEDTDEFFKNRTETDFSTASPEVTTEPNPFAQRHNLHSDEDNGVGFCGSTKRTVWPKNLMNIHKKNFTIEREHSIRVVIENCLYV